MKTSMCSSCFVLVIVMLSFSMDRTIASGKRNASLSIFPSYPSAVEEEEKENDTGELKTFHQVENKMRGIIDDVIKKVLPYVVRASADIRLSGKCMASIFKLVIGMQKLQSWAIRMVDATGKPPSGVIQGTSMSLGHFDECLDVRVGRREKVPEKEEDEIFHGKYCTVECKLPKGLLDAIDEYDSFPAENKSQTPLGKSKTFLSMLVKLGPYIKEAAFRFGVCIPSTCGETDLGSIVGTATKNIGFPMKVLHCQEKQKLKLKSEHIAILLALGSVISAVLVGSLFQAYFIRKPLDPPSTKNRWREIASSLSIANNTRKLFQTENDTHPFPVLRGMFFLTVVFNILAHTYLMYNHLFFFKYSSVLNYLEFMQQFSFSFIANGSNGIENYFFIAGFLMTYARWRLPLKKVTVDIPKLLIKPYIRMSLLQLLAISLFLLLPLIGHGPFWKDFVGPYIQNCQKRWWLNILYVQNYWASEDSCLYHTWLLAAIMQLYVLSIGILWFLINKPNYGVAIIITIIVVGMATVGATVFVKQLPGALSLYLVDLETGVKMWNSLFIQTFDHTGAFCIGLLTGYVLAKYQHTFKLKAMTVVVCWCIAIASFLAVIFGLYEYRYGGVQMTACLSILYAMLNRNVYALFLAWLMIACATGNASCIPSILSWKAFIPGYRLSFLAYLIHLIVIYYHVGILRERVYLSHEENIINYFGYLVSTYIISFICYLFFQAPFAHLEAVVIRKLSQWTKRCHKQSSDLESGGKKSEKPQKDPETKSDLVILDFCRDYFKSKKSVTINAGN